MDSIVNAALEEVCSQGINGICLPDLWPRLQTALLSSGLHLCDGVKRAIWNGLLNIPGLRFQVDNTSSFDSKDDSIQSVEESERIKLKIVAAEHLRDCFVGLYDLKAADAAISEPQRRALERLAIARTNGITQSQFAKEFGGPGKMFYILKNLQSRGLVASQKTIVRTKEACNGREKNGSKINSIVSTNSIYLYRYAKHLGSHQRIEITKEDPALECSGNEDGGDIAAGVVKEDVLVKDFTPAMKAVCDKLEEANGKVLVVTDIKQALGYQKPSGHRAWRSIVMRLKDAGYVEEFPAEVNKKEVSCLRLLKKLTLKNVGCGSEDFDDQLVKCGKRGQITDQLVELPIEHQIYDMIDAEGSNGMTIVEICKRLGLNGKKYYTRLLNMFLRFGMHLRAETHNRGKVYRVWTSGNVNHGSSTVFPGKSKDSFSGDVNSTKCAGDLILHDKSAPVILKIDALTSNGESTTTEKMKNGQLESEFFHGSPDDVDSNRMLISGSSSCNFSQEQGGTISDAELDLVNMVTESNIFPLKASSSNASNLSKLRSFPQYPCLNFTEVSAQREQRIIKRLQDEKFVLTVELYRWLESLEKDKHTTMARKTLTRTLNKLQQEGLCRCILVSVPVVTNCGRTRTTEVVLHPSVQNLSPELLGQIHDRLRSFDMKIRGQGFARMKNDQPIPVLTDVQRTRNAVDSEDPAARSEAMRANGFVLAKMVRAKLLHNFLWGYLSSSPDWDDTLSSGNHGYDLKNPHSTCKLFELDAAIKAMPLELFLQVAGSTQKFEDLIEKCKRGLCLSDISLQEYKSLMNAQATGRLSWIIDILRRLKLIRLVNGRHSEDVEKGPDAILRHAMELKPYIEEPFPIVPSSFAIVSLDLRPRIRHDFILSSREAVDIYWKTLEYCYAAADPKAALHAFPGSAVHEVFLQRSWASVRVMTADQHAELLKRIINDNPDKPNEKLSFKECEKIARDLNLSLEQVLRVYSDKRLQRLNRFQQALKPKGMEFEQVASVRKSASRKRTESSVLSSSKKVKFDTTYTDSGEHDIHLQAYDDDDDSKTVEGSGQDEEENYDFVGKCAFPRPRPTRHRKFSWTEESDRKLVIQYVRYRAALGAKFHRIDWAALPDLPAPPRTCSKRMTILNSNLNFRKAIMRLCNVLTERYAKHLVKLQEKGMLICNDYGQMIQGPSLEGISRNFSSSLENFFVSDSEEQPWDDFEDQNVKVAFDEVFRCKQVAKLEAYNRVLSVSDMEWLDPNLETPGYDPKEGPKSIPSSIPGKKMESHVAREYNDCGRRSSRHRLPRKLLRLLSDGISVSQLVYKSLAVSNAVELLKLVFLSTSTAPEVPTLLAETLRRYSEHDLFSAFNYLREKKFMVGGNGSQPFVLSQQFLHTASSSPFPTNTGKCASKFSNWLHEREKDLIDAEVHLNAELQCGDITHMFALVSLGELVISPRLPDDGIGEAEEQKTLKRKNDKEKHFVKTIKKQKSLLTSEFDIESRREKGFPGIMVSLSRAKISRADTVELFKNELSCRDPLFFDENHQVNATFGVEESSNLFGSDHLKASHQSSKIVPVSVASAESPWESISTYAEHLKSTLSDSRQLGPFHPEVFKNVYTAIQKAGDQGLSMEKVFQVMDMPGETMPEFIVDVLQVFALVMRVNAYDCVHAVDVLYRSKYFLTSSAGGYQYLKPAACMKSPRTSDEGHVTLPPDHKIDADISQRETSLKIDDVHKVTVLNLPAQALEPSNEIQSGYKSGSHMRMDIVSQELPNNSDTFQCTSGDSHSFRPVLPWINGDGTTNAIVYRGLTRRVLGIVMQNPGILEDDLIRRMDVLNPQSCRKLLELMILDNHLIVRKMHQIISSGPPAILGSLLRSRFKGPKLTCREHFFANPLSTCML